MTHEFLKVNKIETTYSSARNESARSLEREKHKDYIQNFKDMKIIILLLTLIIADFTVKAQSIVLADNSPRKENPRNISRTDKAPLFVFNNYGIDLRHEDLKEYPQHVLGDQVARKMYATQKVYVRKHSTDISFMENTVEIYKPAIYNSILKLDNYFKKAVRRQEMDTQKACDELSECLDIAYLAYYEEKTEELEKTLKKAKSPEELLAVFHSISIKE